MSKLFETIPVPRFPRNTFPLSRSVMFTPRFHKVYAPNVIEVLPGDGFNEGDECFARTQPMVAPTFAKIRANQESFFVPGWQLYEHFDDFITGGERGDYNEKLPYIHVEDLYYLCETVLLLGYDDLDTLIVALEEEGELNPLTVSQIQAYNFALEKVQCVMEHCDLMRAIPFVLPDFVLAPEDDEVAAANVIISNFESFSELNSKLKTCNLRVNLMPFGAYMKVYSEFYRDENLCEDFYESIWKSQFGPYQAVGYYDLSNLFSTPPDFGDLDDFKSFCIRLCAMFGVMPRAWKKDYYTSALPFTQKGPDVLIPLSGSFPVDFYTPDTRISDKTDLQGQSTTPSLGGPLKITAKGSSVEIKGNVTLDNSGLASTIVDLRRAFRLEEFYEADARGGNRYPENTMSQWGVRTPDTRLPRAQYLGGSSQPLSISEVVQTSATEKQPTPQGTLAGKGTSYGSNKLVRAFFTLHGILFNFWSARVHTVYEQGIHPMFSRFDRTEYAWPRFANLGEQPIYTKQLHVGNGVKEDEVFGYTPRYAEYKAETSSVHGLLKGSLNYWTMSRRFSNKPVLSEEFIYSEPRLDNFAVVNPLQPPFIVEIDYRVRASRLLPFFGVPTL